MRPKSAATAPTDHGIDHNQLLLQRRRACCARLLVPGHGRKESQLLSLRHPPRAPPPPICSCGRDGTPCAACPSHPWLQAEAASTVGGCRVAGPPPCTVVGSRAACVGGAAKACQTLTHPSLRLAASTTSCPTGVHCLGAGCSKTARRGLLRPLIAREPSHTSLAHRTSQGLCACSAQRTAVAHLRGPRAVRSGAAAAARLLRTQRPLHHSFEHLRHALQGGVGQGRQGGEIGVLCSCGVQLNTALPGTWGGWALLFCALRTCRPWCYLLKGHSTQANRMGAFQV